MLETIKLINKGISNMNQIVGLLKTIICNIDNNEMFKLGKAEDRMVV